MRKRLMRYLSGVLSWDYLGKCLAVLILLEIHEYTKYPTDNRFNIFYWPEGICLDVFAVMGILSLSIWVLWDQFRFFLKVMNEDL